MISNPQDDVAEDRIDMSVVQCAKCGRVPGRCSQHEIAFDMRRGGRRRLAPPSVGASLA